MKKGGIRRFLGGTGSDQELDFEYVKFEIPSKHQNGNVPKFYFHSSTFYTKKDQC